jgi:AcrR family transcriptional regulator
MSRLSKEAWLDFGLARLAADGHTVLTAQGLAKGLGVTRGSFYWHFDSLEAFCAALIAHWTARTTGPVVQDVGQVDDPVLALHRLLARTMQSGARLERAVRAWATVDSMVAGLVDQVDQWRIATADHILRRIGVPVSQASLRARVLYWTAIGRLMMPFPEKSRLTPEEVADLARLMARPEP